MHAASLSLSLSLSLSVSSAAAAAAPPLLLVFLRLPSFRNKNFRYSGNVPAAAKKVIALRAFSRLALSRARHRGLIESVCNPAYGSL
jgi:hypothetical protein